MADCPDCGFRAYASAKPTASAACLDDDGRVLFSRRAGDPFAGKWDLPGGFIDEEEHPIVLARNVRAFEMEFWDRRENDWIDEWTETNALPPMVKITLQFNHDASSRMRDEISAVVALPSITVPPVWQNAGRGPGAVPRQGTRR